MPRRPRDVIGVSPEATASWGGLSQHAHMQAKSAPQVRERGAPQGTGTHTREGTLQPEWAWVALAFKTSQEEGPFLYTSHQPGQLLLEERRGGSAPARHRHRGDGWSPKCQLVEASETTDTLLREKRNSFIQQTFS